VNRVAIVTGGGTGIGRATALALAEDGLAIVLAGRRPDPLAAVASEVAAAGGRAIAVSGDLSVEENAARVVGTAVEAFGGLHVVVNNAGVIRRNIRLHEVGVDLWDELLAINLRGPLPRAPRRAAGTAARRRRPLHRQRLLDAGGQARPGRQPVRGGQGRADRADTDRRARVRARTEFAATWSCRPRW
jgi:NAD(P)-dependent dehydrogenase (short-subunit alcohol dehydrogenase family)